MTRAGKVWWSVQVELLGGGRAGELWPHPGRTFVVCSAHTFHEFAEAIDAGFARWDRSHLHEFHLPLLGKTVTEHRYADDVDPERELDADTVTLGQVLEPGNEFGYVFDLGDNWRHWCTIRDAIVDPTAVLGQVPERPTPVFGWGSIPDAYGRLFLGDDGESPVPEPPVDFVWPAIAKASHLTTHAAGQYTLTRSVADPTDEHK